MSAPTTLPEKPHSESPPDLPLFHNVVFAIDKAMNASKRESLHKQLIDNGAKEASADDNQSSESLATHIFTTRHYPVTEIQANQHVVSPRWVEAAVKNGHIHLPRYYSTNPHMIFSGVVVSTTGIPRVDREAIFGGVTALGGQFRESLTRDVTHLVCIAPQGEKYNMIMAHPEMDIKIVLPHWFDDSFRFRRLVPEESYLFPDPPYLQTLGTTPNALRGQPREDQLIYAYPTEASLPEAQLDHHFLQGKPIFFGPDIVLTSDFLSQLHECVTKAGATVANEYGDDVQVVVLRYRSGDIYQRAYKDKKMVVSLWWLSNTLHRGLVESPLRILLDFPRPKGGIPGMENMIITTSSYSGVARAYLVRLIEAVGARYTPSLSDSNTHLICCSKRSDKFRSARQRNCAIINHLWLEECYQQWRLKSVTDERYVYFPGADILSGLVGATPLLIEELDRWAEPSATPSVVDLDVLRSRPFEALGEQGSVVVNKRKRQAATAAADTLKSLVIPDMNAYEKERKNKKQRSNPEEDTSQEGSQQDELDHDQDLSTPGSENHAVFMQTDSAPQSPKPKRTPVSTYRIATSGVTLATEDKTEIRRLGGILTDNIDLATHLVVEGRVLRTPKFLCAINLGLAIVRLDWLRDSASHGEWLDDADYAVKDTEMESQFKFNLAQSLSTATDSRKRTGKPNGAWLDGYDIYIHTNSKRDGLRDVVVSAGGRVVARPTTRRLRDLAAGDTQSQLLVLVERDDQSGYRDMKKMGIPVYDKELVITGTYRQSLDLDSFIL